MLWITHECLTISRAWFCRALQPYPMEKNNKAAWIVSGTLLSTILSFGERTCIKYYTYIQTIHACAARLNTAIHILSKVKIIQGHDVKASQTQKLGFGRCEHAVMSSFHQKREK